MRNVTQPSNIVRLFEAQIDKYPDKTAVIACDATLTYLALNEQANMIAHSLIAKGLGTGDIIAIKLSRKSYLFSAMIAVLKLGAVYMPIDPTYPDDRAEYLLAESKATYCIDEANIAELLANGDPKNLNVVIEPNCGFCALHTSGSTGKPKLSLLNHGNMINFLIANKSFWHNIDTVVSATIVTFDAFVMDSVLSVALGKQVVLASEDEIYNQALFEKLFEYSDSNMFFATPTKIEKYIKSSNVPPFCFCKIKSFVIGGEVFSGNLLELIKNVSPKSKIYNIYGPTETTICVTVAEVTDIRDIHIGKPIANTQIYIVDKFMNIMPIGVTGELCIAGDGVGAGYLNRPELTAEKFIDNPFGEGKLYKTGDLAYWREDGNIAYVGRNDFQVKIRGLRIELGEIENAIDGIDGISQAVVVVRKNSEGRQMICAFYTGLEVDAKEIRNHIGKKLPKYMLPHIFTHLDEMPLTSSGKVNRKALPEVDLYSIDTSVEYVAPVSGQEKALATAIGTVLGIERVSLLDNFFDLGGDSLKAIELISKLDVAGYHTDIKTIFSCDTVRTLAENLTSTRKNAEEFICDGDIPATAAQMRIYTAQEMHHDSTVYNVPYAFHVSDLDVNRLQMAVDAMVDRHEILRTSFDNKDGNIIQIISPTAECIVEKLESDDIGAFMRPFDLSKAPLLRVGYSGNTMIIDMHHIITDGSSMPIFLRELNELYMGRTLKNDPVPYKLFAVQEQNHAESENYWMSVYGDEVPVLEINTDYHRGQKQSINGKAIYNTVEITLHKQILVKCKQLNITPYVFYMGAFNILLSIFSRSEDIVVGMPISGRSSKYLDTIGMFVNTIALRNQPVGTKTVAKFLQEVKENSVVAIDHQDYPYGELVKKLHIDTPGRNPLFDVMFAYQSEQMTDVVFADKKAELLPIPVTTSKYDFTFNIMPRDNDVVLMVEYCTDLYKEHTIQRLLDGYKQVVVQMLNVQREIKDISAITEQERQKILYHFNDTAADYPRDRCIHQLFEEQVRKTPDKVAVIACDKTLTYGQLNRQANRIAHSLINRGVAVGDIVAFSLPRRTYMIAAMLGILKAGAAYLPIDPDCPQDRINYMLKDSNAKLYINEETFTDLDDTNPINDVHSSDSCYHIYTSGTTGKPKAVSIRHQNVVNFCTPSTKNHFQNQLLNACDCVLAINNISFDITLQETLLPLLNGSKIAVSPDTTNVADICKIMNGKRLGLIITPTKMEAFMKDNSFCERLKNFVVIMIGAETLHEKLVRKIGKLTNATIINGYGPTETTCGSCYANIEHMFDGGG